MNDLGSLQPGKKIWAGPLDRVAFCACRDRSRRFRGGNRLEERRVGAARSEGENDVALSDGAARRLPGDPGC
jgi:hypothetical protein